MAHFVFAYEVGDVRIEINDLAYCLTAPNLKRVDGTVSPEERQDLIMGVMGGMRELEGGDDGSASPPERMFVRLGGFQHEVRFVGCPNQRIADLKDLLAHSLVGDLLRKHLPDDARPRVEVRYHVNSMGGDTTITVVDTAYRVSVDGGRDEGTLTAVEVDEIVRLLEEHDAWTLDGRSEREQPTCMSIHNLSIRLGRREHRVKYYGSPNHRIDHFAEAFQAGVFGRLIRRARGLGDTEIEDAYLLCTECASKGHHATGSTTCRQHGTGLLRTEMQSDGWPTYRCAACAHELRRQGPASLWAAVSELIAGNRSSERRTCPGCAAKFTRH